MRLGLACAVVLAVALPFAFADAGYVVEQYRVWILKLRQVSSALPQEWEAQADFTAMLEHFSFNPMPPVADAIRGLAALGTLALALRVGRTQTPRVFGLALLLLSACYINLFNPRNETISFLVLTPGLTALGLVLIMRDDSDRRGWLLILAVLVIGYEWWWFDIDQMLKPAVVFVVSGWLIWLTVRPERWRELIGDAVIAASPKVQRDSVKMAPAFYD